MERGVKNKRRSLREFQKGPKCSIVSVQGIGPPEGPQPFTSRLSREKLCVACLSSSSVRKMYPLEDTLLFFSITCIKLRAGSMVCYECNAMLLKIKEFKDKALKAHSIFSSCIETTPPSLSTLVENNLLNWVSISFKPHIETNPLDPTDTNNTSFKEESDETEILTSEPKDLNLTDPFSLHSEVEIKEEELAKEYEGCMDIIKCEYDSQSSDDEPLVNTVKAKQAYIQMSGMDEDSSGTDSASECTESPRISNQRKLSVPNLPNTTTQSSLHITNVISSISPPLIPNNTKCLLIPPSVIPKNTKSLLIPPSLNPNIPKPLPTLSSFNPNKPKPLLIQPSLNPSNTKSLLIPPSLNPINTKSLPIPPSLTPNDSTSLPIPSSLNANMHKPLPAPPFLNPNAPISLPLPPSLIPKSLNRLELPIALVASSLLTSLPTPKSQEGSTSQKKDALVEYHSGTKLFKYSPQLTIPKMFQTAVEPPKEPTPGLYEIKRISDEEVAEYRAERLKMAKQRLWQNFCTQCLRKFRWHQDYQDHFKNHDQTAGRYVCDICKLRYPTQKEADEHKEEHYKQYICMACREKFYSLDNLKKHDYMAHNDEVKYCRHCDEKFTNTKEFYMHNRTHQKVVKCKFCDKEMKASKLGEHVKYRHEPQPLLECEICHKEFQGRKRLYNHRTYMHSQKNFGDRGYCVECNAWFKTQALYLAHLKTTLKHRGAGDKYPCTQCERTFATPSGLNKHVRVLHEHAERSQCDICQKVYQSKKAIRSHIMRFHLKMRTASEQRDKVCDICGKAFRHKACLEQHINSHLNIRPFKCEHCGATFSYSGARYMHVKLKHKKQAKPET